MVNRGLNLSTLLLVSMLAGCAAPVEFESEDVGGNTQFLFDSTGTISISVTTCGWTEHEVGPKSTRCKVADEHVLVGGGAEIESTPVPNGALLNGSFPSKTTQEWVASAKDHNLPQKFRLRASAIGLKLAGISRSDLLAKVAYNALSGSAGALSTKEIPVPSGHIVLGGGASTNGLHLLVASKPKIGSSSTPTGWVAVSKDHNAPSNNSVWAHIISMPPCITGWGCVQTKTITANSGPAGNGHKSVTLKVFEPVTTTGAEAVYSGNGRMLTDIWPTEFSSNVEVMASSRDHQISSSGVTHVYAVSIQRWP
jgi:hypothetical protein